MTVAELIEALHQYPAHHEVKVDGRPAVEVSPSWLPGNSPAVMVR